nr:cysteine-rich receptor-like protein kinase 2 [Ipomoea trifida]
MAGSGSLWWLAVVILMVSAFSDPQTNQIGTLGCSNYHLTDADAPDYIRELNISFADLRNQLSSANKRFATSTQLTIYAMVQCRKYLSTADCVACFDAAVPVTRDCPVTASSAIVIFDGCFLRYRNSYFYDQTTDEVIGGASRVCGNRTASKQHIFNATTQQLLNQLLLATPRINGFYAAAKLQEEPPTGGATTYAVAQCAETVSQSSCKGNSSGKKKPIIVAGVVGTVGIILVLGALFLFYRQSWKANAWRRGNILGAKYYIYKDLKAATNDFSEENVLGKGGFGDVYKGTLQSRDVVAVKKLTTISSRAKANFETEISLITNANHPNLIRLLGYSGNGKVLILVYEYMANASLDRYIYGEKRGMLNWKQRVDIILGTARGLAYLHEQFDAWKLYENDEHLGLVDNNLDPNEYEAEEVKRMLEIALVCTQSPSKIRPSMSEVVVMLSSTDASIIQKPQNRPTTITDFNKRIPTTTNTSILTNATISFSRFSGR